MIMNKKGNAIFEWLMVLTAVGAMTYVGHLSCKRESEPRRIELKVNECEEDRLNPTCYRGMPSEKTFSLSGEQSAHGSTIYTFYPANADKVAFGSREYKVVDVKPDKIILDYFGA